MKNIIIGTAGHIDHGKTTLIKALTGKDTDRLKEEKLRGITTDLGFAYFDLPSGIRAGIIDVPGHEKFIKNMLAGAHGIDIVMLVIAADEGVMPQTKEHVDILSFLDIKAGIIVLTKCDLVEKDWLLIVEEDVRENLKGTFLENAPIVHVSSVTGEGLDILVNTLDELAQKVKERSSEGIFRLPVDRVFSIAGFGTVVTGTLISGKIKVGDKVMIYPKMIESRVRNLQVHERNVECAFAGQRTAINLANVKVEEIERGDVIAPPEAIIPSTMIDVKLSLLKEAKTLKNRERIRFYTGASEVIGRAVLLDRDELHGGESCYAQIYLEDCVSVLRKDKFVIRTYSPMLTIGGGIILDPNPEKHKRFDIEVIETLSNIEKLGDKFVIEKLVYESLLPLSEEEIKRKANVVDIGKFSLKNLIKLKLEEKDYFYHREKYEEMCLRTKEILEDFHRKNPLKEGISKEELKNKLFGDIKSKLCDFIFELMEKEEIIKIKNQLVALKDFKVVLNEEQEKLKERIIKIYRDSKFEPPKLSELEGYPEIIPMVEYLVNIGELVKLDEEIFLSKDNYEEAQNVLINYLKENKEITLAVYRDLLNTSRKYAMAILEYFDSIKLTKRIGDVRVLAREIKN
ncbi:MAG: Selenocysteine-specific translation elongation factor [Caldanaerobacter subterraneus]|uniref:Selenocysteine-specific elongation factor n=3 Tax=Caldanaerobacter subterraneus TaxID=911092 RepID=Q8R8W5_CALS4|nr:selenocysteine-specific translation elongation factor [Caldanaerobacter subterraneus]AAM25058.1 Selenocysteine-specific translation elongation factor [Caldanaerobacter subterraneus subsp. tengcongensis MB4]KKC29237.1 selenocysteine-specific translation elongation factor [Caldanaerobacter subterraneus subsp. pacificus DSM 12653]KUK08339.1 MAG: Selenocysteine-specific translation elongation factor [Caldanaerobacter subterraneus]MCS3915358.1 selenocysteine-specific elongation factor [Caldanaero